MKKKKTNNNGILIFGAILIVILLVLGIMFIKNRDKATNTNIDEAEELSELNIKLDDIDRHLGWVTIVSAIDKTTTSGVHTIAKNRNLIEDESDKQLLTMEYIIANNELSDKFIIINSDTTEVITDETLTSDSVIAYLPYDEFNSVYKELFGSNFDRSKAKISSGNTTYDNNNDYVYYENRKSGLNGQYVEKIEANKVSYDGKTNIYTAEVTVTYSTAEALIIGYDQDNATITYKKNNDNIYLESFIITE